MQHRQAYSGELKSRKNSFNCAKFTNDLFSSPISSKIDYAPLEGLELADPWDEDNGSCINVLVGSDFYWNIVTDDIIRGESGPTAIRSKLGWLLSGPVEGCQSNSGKTVANVIIAGEADNILAVNDQDAMTNSVRQFWETDPLEFSIQH